MPVDIESIRRAISSTSCTREEVEEVLAELERLRAKARALIAALPKCERALLLRYGDPIPRCEKTAIGVEREYERVTALCEEHAPCGLDGKPDFIYDWAAPLRDLQEVLGNEPT